MTAGVTSARTRVPPATVRRRPPRSRPTRSRELLRGGWFGWWCPVALFLLTRAYAALAVLAQAGRRAGAGPDIIAGDGSTGYGSIIANWDGQWYERIATGGYPLPAEGATDPSVAATWAFPPLFPMLVRLLMGTGMGFGWAVSLIDLVAGALAMVLLFSLLQRRAGRVLAMSGVALVCCFVTAPLLQAAYSESLALLLLVTVFWALVERHYALALLAVVLLSYTRIVTPPLAVVVAAHLLARWRAREVEPLPLRHLLWLGVLAAASLAGALAWALTAALFGAGSTGAATRPGSVAFHLGWFSGSYSALGIVGPLLVAVLVGCLVLLSLTPGASRWGAEVRTWLWCYPLFLVTITPLTSGILRYLLLCFPLGLAGVHLLTRGSTRTCSVVTATTGLCLLGLVLQWWWVGVALVDVRGLMP